MKEKCFMLCAVVMLTGTLLAQNPQLTLSLDQAKQYAVQHNYSLQNAALDVKIAHAQRWQTIASMLPQVDGSVGYTSMFDYVIPVLNRPMTPYLSTGVTASVGLNGQAIMGALLNNVAIEMQDITHAKTERQLEASVIQSYMAVLVMEDVVQLLDSSLVNLQKLEQQTKMAVQVGAQESTAADQIAVRVNALKNNISANHRSLELAYNNLRVLLGVSANTEIKLTQTLSELLNAEMALSLLSENFNINNNFDYQLLQKSTDLAKKNVTMAALAYVPTVSAYYQYTYRKDFGEGGFNMTPPNTLGVSVSVPIWSSGKRAAGVTEKKLAYQQAQNTMAETTDRLGIQNQQLRFNVANAYEAYVNEKENIEVTKRVFRNVTNKYQYGVSSSLELVNASNDLISVQSSYVQAVLTLVNAQVDLITFLNN